MMDAFGVERSEEISKTSANVARQLARMAGTEGSAGTYATQKLAARAAGRKSARRSAAQGRTSRAGKKAAAKSRSALARVASEPRAGSVSTAETAAANAIKNNRTRPQKVLQAVGSGSRAVGTRVRAVGSSVGSGTATAVRAVGSGTARTARAVGSGTARASRAVGSGTVRATRAVGSGTARAGRTVRASMTRTPKPPVAAPVTSPTAAPVVAPPAATGTEAGTAAVKNKSRFGRNTALIGGGAAIGAGGMAYSVDRNNQMMSKSAFGITHELSKFVAGGAAIKGIGAITKPAATLKPIAATKAAYQGGRALNLNRATSAGYAAGTFIRKAPKTAIAIGAGTAAAGGAGIGYMSKGFSQEQLAAEERIMQDAFGVEISKARYFSPQTTSRTANKVIDWATGEKVYIPKGYKKVGNRWVPTKARNKNVASGSADVPPGSKVYTKSENAKDAGKPYRQDSGSGAYKGTAAFRRKGGALVKPTAEGSGLTTAGKFAAGGAAAAGVGAIGAGGYGVTRGTRKARANLKMQSPVTRRK